MFIMESPHRQLAARMASQVDMSDALAKCTQVIIAAVGGKPCWGKRGGEDVDGREVVVTYFATRPTELIRQTKRVE